MAVLGDFFGGLAPHNVHQMPCTEAHPAHLLDAVDGAEQFAGCICAIPYIGRVQAVVAVAARQAFLAEVTQ